MDEEKKKTLREMVLETIDFFEGFEYGETQMVMSSALYEKHKPEMREDADGNVTFADMPVRINGLDGGFVLLTGCGRKAEKA